MDLSTILIIVGILVIIISILLPNKSKKLEQDLETLSIDYYQNQHQLKRRLKVIEEELMLPTSSVATSPKKKTERVHEIIVSQVKALHQQGYSINEICTRSSLTSDQVKAIIGGIE